MTDDDERALEPTEADPALEPTGADPALEPTEADPALEPTEANPEQQPTDDDPAQQPSPDAGPEEPTSAEGAVEPTRTPPGMAILVSVPFEIAKRIESFLVGHGIACEIQRVDTPAKQDPATATKPRLSHEPYDSGMRHAAKNLLRFRSTPPTLPDLTFGQDPRPVYDVLVREEDLAVAGAEGEETGDEMLEMVQGVAGELVVVSRLPWQEAWALAARLTEEGIPAAAVPEGDDDRETALDKRIVPVAVRPEDLEAARAALGQ